MPSLSLQQRLDLNGMRRTWVRGLSAWMGLGLALLMMGCGNRMHTIETDADPTYLALDARGRYVYIVCAGSRSLWVWDLERKKKSAAAPLPAGPYRLVLERNNQSLRVLCQNARQIITFRVPELRRLHTLSVADKPSAWLQIPETRHALIASAASHSLRMYLKTDFLNTIPVGQYPVDMLWQTETDRVWVANFKGQELAVVSLNKNRVIKQVPVWFNPLRLCLDPFESRVFVLCTGQDAAEPKSMVQLVDTTYQSVGLSWPAGKDARDMCLDPKGRALFVLTGDKIIVLSARTGIKLREMKTGKNPQALVASPDGLTLYVACQDSQAVAVHRLDPGIFRKR